MFEIWSLGEKPLRDIPIQNVSYHILEMLHVLMQSDSVILQVAKTIAEGYCQPPPPGTPEEIYRVMVQCW